MVFIRKEFVKHNVVDYSHIDNVLNRINGRPPKIKSLMPVIDTSKKSYIISTFRSDLLGAFLQGIFNQIITKSSTGNIFLDISHNQLCNFSDYSENQNPNIWKITGCGNKNDNINYRIICLNILFPYDQKDIGLNDSEKISSDVNGMLDNKSIHEKTSLLDEKNNRAIFKRFRTGLKRYLPCIYTQRSYVAIHFRAGDVINMSERYIHSSEYDNILKFIKKTYDMPIFVFISTLPPTEKDDLLTFKKYGCKLVTSDMCNTLETLSVFIHANIFIMAKSSFSHVANLVRDHRHTLTFYRDFWHKKLHINNLTWNKNGIGS